MLLITKRNGNVHRNVQVFIGMSKSRQGITNGAETATNVPCDSTGKQRTMRPAIRRARRPKGTVKPEFVKPEFQRFKGTARTLPLLSYSLESQEWFSQQN
jgi:hypothetical protein